MSAAAVDGPYDWPSEFIQLKRIDNLLRCNICFEFFNIAMIVPSCSHNYCSFCIRKHITHKECCPTCNLPLVGGDLKCNRILDELVSYFKPVRNHLITLLRDYLKHGVKQSDLKDKGKINAASRKNTSDDELEFAAMPSFRCPNSSHNRSKRVESSNLQEDNSQLVELTPCPVCSKEVPIQGINLHLDQCLNDETQISSTLPSNSKSSKPQANSKTSSVVNTMKPLPATCLDALEDSELKAKAKKYGLPSYGDRKQLMTRIEQYILLYNSQCDSRNPMSAAMIVKQVCKNERNLIKTGYKPNILIHTHDNRYSDQEKENFNAKYGKKHEKHYQQLIGEVKDRLPKKACIQNIDELGDNVDKIVDKELIIEVEGNTPEKRPVAINDHSAFGHVPEWFDTDLLKPNVNGNRKRLEESNVSARSKSKKAAKNKKKPVKSGNIASYFPQKGGVGKKVSEDVIQNDESKKGESSRNLLDSGGEDSNDSDQMTTIQTSPCLVEDTDEEEEMRPTSRKLPLILESEDEDEMIPDSPSSLDSVSSPSILEPDKTTDAITVTVKKELVHDALERLNSTAIARESHLTDITLSPVPPWKKRCSENVYDQGHISEGADKSLDKSHFLGLSGEISNLVETACRNPRAFNSDSDDEFQFTSSEKVKPVPDKNVHKNTFTSSSGSKKGNVIPLPPSDSFEIDSLDT